MKSINLTNVLLAGIFVVAVFIAAYLGAFKALPVLGSTVQGNDYSRISYANSNVYGATTTPGKIKGGYGSVGSVVITGAAAGLMNFYDATTTDATKRDVTQATSSILLFSIPASLVAGTYTFDVAFGRGLIVDIVGTFPTSTVTYR